MLKVNEPSSDSYEIYAEAVDNDGNSLWTGQSGGGSVTVGTLHTVTISQDLSGTNSVAMELDGTQFFTSSGFTIGSIGTCSITGSLSSSNNQTLVGMIVDSKPGRQAAARDWIKGNDYTP